ncbi:(2Fe-2S)-binding protein [Halobacteriales archaeon QH_7_68_42]|jgi:nitrite reductase/ring-hydroxylating ferredoxin subunit|nr:MAG: (2Fe-2S)-binding protein [Halobacteriales archaeon QH_7_68_42]PSP90283.1 MAG: (2Fe-2S)-binding protein [Halobacteriales archaeon QH_8_68_33]
MSTDGRIADLAEVPTDDTLLFRVRSVGEDERPGDEADEREAILLRLADDAGDPTDDVVGWLNVCQHMTHIPLDKGSGAPVRDGEVVCANHGAMFDAASGECTYGPCEGAFLAEVGVTVDEGGVYLDDDAYEFAGRGPVPDDDDLSSDSNVIL